jgi:hypothetical protein
MANEQKCRTCNHWDVKLYWDYHEGTQGWCDRIARHDGADCDNVVSLSNMGEPVQTGPEFGCIHWEKQYDTHEL